MQRRTPRLAALVSTLALSGVFSSINPTSLLAQPQVQKAQSRIPIHILVQSNQSYIKADKELREDLEATIIPGYLRSPDNTTETNLGVFVIADKNNSKLYGIGIEPEAEFKSDPQIDRATGAHLRRVYIYEIPANINPQDRAEITKALGNLLELHRHDKQERSPKESPFPRNA